MVEGLDRWDGNGPRMFGVMKGGWNFDLGFWVLG